MKFRKVVSIAVAMVFTLGSLSPAWAVDPQTYAQKENTPLPEVSIQEGTNISPVQLAEASSDSLSFMYETGTLSEIKPVSFEKILEPIATTTLQPYQGTPSPLVSTTGNVQIPEGSLTTFGGGVVITGPIYVDSNSTLTITADSITIAPTGSILTSDNNSLLSFSAPLSSGSFMTGSMGPVGATMFMTNSIVTESLVQYGTIDLSGFAATITPATQPEVSITPATTTPSAIATPGNVVIDGPIYVDPNSTLSITGDTVTITSGDMPSTGTGAIMPGGSIVVETIPKTETLITTGELQLPVTEIIAYKMEQVADLLKKPTEGLSKKEVKELKKEIVQAQNALQKTVTGAIESYRPTDRAFAKTLKKTWNEFKQTVLQPAKVQDLKSGGNTAKIAAYQEGSRILRNLIVPVL